MNVRSQRQDELRVGWPVLLVTFFSAVVALGESDQTGASSAGYAFTELPLWDDGLSEMCYYAAVDTIYGQPRDYIRVHMFNRQWMDPITGVKESSPGEASVPVFKLNIAEEIPTENYNYRYLTTVYLRREGLSPFKMVVSSQEWCGATYKHLRWSDDQADISSFSYFPEEGEKRWRRPAVVAPFESVFVLARAVAVAGRRRDCEMLSSMRSNREVNPEVSTVTLVPAERTRPVDVPLGRFEARRVTLRGTNPPGWFDVEVVAPYRLLAFSADGVHAELIDSERRAYWDRSKESQFYKQGKAP